jgi:hypothetical protein
VAELFIKGSAMMPKFKQANWIQLNVGGKIYLTHRKTLASRESIFRHILSADEEAHKNRWKNMLKFWERSPDKVRILDPQRYYQMRQKSYNEYYIDRDPRYFEAVLHYMRYGKLSNDINVDLDALMDEAEYFQVPELVEVLKSRGIDSEKVEPAFVIVTQAEMKEAFSKADDTNIEPDTPAEQLELTEKVEQQTESDTETKEKIQEEKQEKKG